MANIKSRTYCLNIIVWFLEISKKVLLGLGKPQLWDRFYTISLLFQAAAAKSLQSCPTLCDPIDGSPPGSPVPGILQTGTLEWVAISFSMHESEKWKWSRLVISDSLQPHGLQPTRLLHPWDFPGKSTGVGCHCLLPIKKTSIFFFLTLQNCISFSF